MAQDLLRFDLPLWCVEIRHHNPKSDGVWARTLNADTEKEAVRTAIALFVSDGLNELLIDEIVPSELIPLEGGEDGNEVS